MAKTIKQHWYRTFVGECPVCGKNASYKERIYGPKPLNFTKRYVTLDNTVTYDFCLEREAI